MKTANSQLEFLTSLANPAVPRRKRSSVGKVKASLILPWLSLGRGEASKLSVPYGLLTANAIPAIGLFGFASLTGYGVPFCGGWLLGFIAATILAGMTFSQEIQAYKKSQRDELVLRTAAGTIANAETGDFRSNLPPSKVVASGSRSKAG